MSRVTILMTAGAMVALVSGVQAVGQQSGTTAATAQTAPSLTIDKTLLADRDEDFVKHAAQSSKVELAASKLAVTNAANAEVRAFAEKLVTDHTKAGAELQAFVVTKKVELKDDDPDLKTKMTKHESLQRLSGSEFDKEYLEDMISDHENAIVLFSNEALKGKDATIKAWAEKQVPGLRDHLKIARDLKAKLFK